VLNACLIKHRFLSLSYSKTVQCKKNDTAFSDHTRVSMCKFMNSATENILLYYINYRTYLFYNFMNIPHWIPWEPEKVSSSLSVPRRAP